MAAGNRGPEPAERLRAVGWGFHQRAGIDRQPSARLRSWAHPLQSGRQPEGSFLREAAERYDLFLTHLACFVHRAQTWWQDTVGRELYGAMALGVPVLCPQHSIHAERIEHGVDGLVYRSSAEALELLSDLRQSPATAAAMGRAGREKMRALLDAVRQERSYREFLVGSGQPRAAVERTGMTKVA